MGVGRRLMQRLTSWLADLPGRRRRSVSARRTTTHRQKESGRKSPAATSAAPPKERPKLIEASFLTATQAGCSSPASNHHHGPWRGSCGDADWRHRVLCFGDDDADGGGGEFGGRDVNNVFRTQRGRAPRAPPSDSQNPSWFGSERLTRNNNNERQMLKTDQRLLRPQIRTNAWLNSSHPHHQRQNTAVPATATRPPALVIDGGGGGGENNVMLVSASSSISSCSSVVTAKQTGVKSSTNSTNGNRNLLPSSSSCASSGYASHDSSPESSVHSPAWHVIGANVQPPNGNSDNRNGSKQQQKTVFPHVDHPLRQLASLAESEPLTDFEGDDDDEEEDEDEGCCDALKQETTAVYDNLLLIRKAQNLQPQQLEDDEDDGELDEEDDEHIYHELEPLAGCWLPSSSRHHAQTLVDDWSMLSSCSSTGSSLPRGDSPRWRSSHAAQLAAAANLTFRSEPDRAESPIYANPHEEEDEMTPTPPLRWAPPSPSPPMGNFQGYGSSYRRQLPQIPREQEAHLLFACSAPSTSASISSRRAPPVFRAPPPPPLPPSTHNTPEEALRLAELDFLAELDAQIAELQLKSSAVRRLVDEARLWREINRRDEQQRLTVPRWHDNATFELCL